MNTNFTINPGNKKATHYEVIDLQQGVLYRSVRTKAVVIKVDDINILIFGSYYDVLTTEDLENKGDSYERLPEGASITITQE